MPGAVLSPLETTPVESWASSSVEDKQTVIRAVYKQVLGNPHLMESERLLEAESKFCEGRYSVRDFVRAVAKSDQYRDRFFGASAPYRFVELNFKHLLGRAPSDQAEISEHIRRRHEAGYEAEIDSYIDSDEYRENFGDNTVPYYRGTTSQVGQKQVAYNRLSALFQGIAGTDKATKASKLVQEVGTNSAAKKIQGPSRGGRIAGYADATEKTFKIVVSGAKFCGPRHRSTVEYIVSGSKMTPQIQRINRTTGKIVSITEIA
jgi:phycoerythrin-associated linker protein